MSRVLLAVPDISCEHCERTIVQALEPLAGLQGVWVDVPARTVTVGYEGRVGVADLARVLAAEDYPGSGGWRAVSPCYVKHKAAFRRRLRRIEGQVASVAKSLVHRADLPVGWEGADTRTVVVPASAASARR